GAGAFGACLMSLARGMRTRGSASCSRGCVPWSRRGMPRTRCCGRSWMPSGGCGGGLGGGWGGGGGGRGARPPRPGPRGGVGGAGGGGGGGERGGGGGGDGKRGGQPGDEGKGLARDPDPGRRREAPPAAQCRRCKAGLDGAELVPGSWAQVIDVLFTTVTT